MNKPDTIEQLGSCAYAGYAKSMSSLASWDNRPWSRLASEKKASWHHAANNVVVRVAAFGYPRPLGDAEEAREAVRCAGWLRYVADGGDAGSETQLRMLLRTSASLLQNRDPNAVEKPINPPHTAMVKALREYLSVHPAITLPGYTLDELALEMARIALEVWEAAA